MLRDNREVVRVAGRVKHRRSEDRVSAPQRYAEWRRRTTGVTVGKQERLDLVIQGRPGFEGHFED